MMKFYFTRIDINIHIEDKTAMRERDEVYNGVRAGDWTEVVEVQSSRGKKILIVLSREWKLSRIILYLDFM